MGLDENGKMLGLDHHHGQVGDSKAKVVWPKLFISLSSKEKEEDFMAMKGCKLPQRPKKRAKFLQKSLLVSFPLQKNLMREKEKILMWLWFLLCSSEFLTFRLCVLQLVMPGSWLSDLCQERYEVREKKASKKVLSFSFVMSFLVI